SAKAEIADQVKKNRGKLFLNADDPMTPFIRDNAEADIIEFGKHNGPDYNFVEAGYDKWGRFSFDFFQQDKKIIRIK
ncbi:MAG TPA: hypothetical protein DCP02_01250, partial [Actinobacteria bacterium]|nr:hypothetical protein [Actinomycetota bacterium]